MNKKINEEILLPTIEKLKSKIIDITTASILLGVSKRQIYKILKKKVDNNKILISEPTNKTPHDLEDKIIKLYKEKYFDFSHTHFYEKLSEVEGININFRTMQRILNNNYLISPFAYKSTKSKLKRKLNEPKANNLDEEYIENIESRLILDPKNIHNRHARISDFGALIQLDAREDYYISKEKWSLHLSIDVSSGLFVGAYFDYHETLVGYQNVLYQIVTNYWIPKCILTDNRTIFEYINKNSKVESKNTLIQIRFTCMNLGINLNTTSVATYKSIIERANGTFGRRLPQELRIRKIKTIEKANLFLKEYLKNINLKFSHNYSGRNVFREAPGNVELCNIISTVTRRSFDKGCCVKYKNEYYHAMIKDKFVAFEDKTKCLVVNTFDGRLIITVDSVPYVTRNIKELSVNYNKQLNPESYRCLNDYKVSSADFVDYNLKHKSIWSYNAFNKYVLKEMEYIDYKYR